MEWNGKALWLLCWMALWTWWDLRYRVIPLWQGILVLMVGVFWQWTEGCLFGADILAGMVLGAASCCFSAVTEDRFGMGDALVILCLGVYHGFAVGVSVFMCGLLIASGVSVYLLLRKRCGSRQSIPLIPFLTAGYVWMLLIGGTAGCR